MITALRRVGAIARRDLLIQLSYQFQLITLLSGPLVTAFLSYYIAGLIDDPDQLRAYDGGYFEFVVSGVGLTAYASFGISTFSTQIRSELGAGTLEVLLSGPTRLSVVLLGGAVVPFGFVTLQAVGLFVVGIGVVGTGISALDLLAAVPVILLTAVTFCALGIASAALVVLVKRGDPISGLLFQASLVMSGAVFPIELFPRWFELLCRATPAYYGVRGVRDALLTDGGVTATFDELAVLGVFAGCMLPIGTWLFARSVRRAKDLGVLASY